MGCGAFCRGPASPKNQPAVSSSPNLAQLRHPIPLGTKVLGEGGVYSYPAVCPESILPTFIYAFTKVFRPPISQHPGPKSTCSQGRPRRGPRSPGPQCPPGGPKSRGPNPLFLLVLRVWTPGVRGGGKGCVGCSHGSDTGLGGASWGHMESRDEECAPGIEPLPECGGGEKGIQCAGSMCGGIGYRAITELSFFSLTCPTLHLPLSELPFPFYVSVPYRVSVPISLCISDLPSLWVTVLPTF